MKKSVILLCGLALIALIIGYSYKEPVDEKEAESDQVIDTADQTPTKTTIEETVVTIEDVETEKDEEMPTPNPHIFSGERSRVCSYGAPSCFGF